MSIVPDPPIRLPSPHFSSFTSNHNHAPHRHYSPNSNSNSNPVPIPAPSPTDPATAESDSTPHLTGRSSSSAAGSTQPQPQPHPSPPPPHPHFHPHSHPHPPPTPHLSATDLLPAHIRHNAKHARIIAFYVSARRILRSHAYTHALRTTRRLISSLPALRAALHRYSSLVGLHPSLSSLSSFSSDDPCHGGGAGLGQGKGLGQQRPSVDAFWQQHPQSPPHNHSHSHSHTDHLPRRVDGLQAPPISVKRPRRKSTGFVDPPGHHNPHSYPHSHSNSHSTSPHFTSSTSTHSHGHKPKHMFTFPHSTSQRSASAATAATAASASASACGAEHPHQSSHPQSHYLDQLPPDLQEKQNDIAELRLSLDTLGASLSASRVRAQRAMTSIPAAHDVFVLLSVFLAMSTVPKRTTTKFETEGQGRESVFEDDVQHGEGHCDGEEGYIDLDIELDLGIDVDIDVDSEVEVDVAAADAVRDSSEQQRKLLQEKEREWNGENERRPSTTTTSTTRRRRQLERKVYGYRGQTSPRPSAATRDTYTDQRTNGQVYGQGRMRHRQQQRVYQPTQQRQRESTNSNSQHNSNNHRHRVRFRFLSHFTHGGGDRLPRRASAPSLGDRHPSNAQPLPHARAEQNKCRHRRPFRQRHGLAPMHREDDRLRPPPPPARGRSPSPLPSMSSPLPSPLYGSERPQSSLHVMMEEYNPLTSCTAASAFQGTLNNETKTKYNTGSATTANSTTSPTTAGNTTGNANNISSPPQQKSRLRSRARARARPSPQGYMDATSLDGVTNFHHYEDDNDGDSSHTATTRRSTLMRGMRFITFGRRRRMVHVASVGSVGLGGGDVGGGTRRERVDGQGLGYERDSERGHGTTMRKVSSGRSIWRR